MKIVYIIKPSTKNDIYKIGHAKDVESRLKSLQTSHFDELEVCHQFETERALYAEQLLHEIFQNKKIRGEWYKLDNFDINFIKRISGFDTSFIWDCEQRELITPIASPVPSISLLVSNVPSKDGLRNIYITEAKLLSFLRAAWEKQEKEEKGLSRSYWTKKRRPRMKVLLYTAIIKLLEDNGMIANRAPGRSGNLIFNPYQSISIIKDNYIITNKNND